MLGWKAKGESFTEHL